MKIFGFEIRVFKKATTTINTVETWIVKWTTFQKGYTIADIEDNMQCFPSKKDADLYAKELRDARKLLGDKYASISVYKQKIHTNA
jgi:hypothetical protein